MATAAGLREKNATSSCSLARGAFPRIADRADLAGSGTPEPGVHATASKGPGECTLAALAVAGACALAMMDEYFFCRDAYSPASSKDGVTDRSKMSFCKSAITWLSAACLSADCTDETAATADIAGVTGYEVAGCWLDEGECSTTGDPPEGRLISRNR